MTARPKPRGRPSLAIASCRDLPAWEVDDAPFHAALTELGVQLQGAPWDAELDWAAFDGVLIRTTWDYVPRWAEFLAWVERVAATGRLLHDAAVIRWNLDKRYLQALEARAVPVIETAWLEPGREVSLVDLLRARGWTAGAILKPAIGASASGTLVVRGAREARALGQPHLERLLAAGHGMVQPYLTRVERDGERSVIALDGQISHAVLKRPRPGDYRVQDDWGGVDEPLSLDAELRAAHEAAIAALVELLALARPPLIARSDWLLDEGGQLRLTELELIEPSLFFRHAPMAASTLAELVVARLSPAGAD